MTIFLRLLAEDDKGAALAESCARVRQGKNQYSHYEVTPGAFNAVPGKPFAYWISENVLSNFREMPPLEGGQTGRVAKRGVNSNDDFRFIRCWWEVTQVGERWLAHRRVGRSINTMGIRTWSSIGLRPESIFRQSARQIAFMHLRSCQARSCISSRD